MHGGAFGSGAPAGERNGAFRHGRQTLAAVAERREIAALVAEVRLLARTVF